MPPPVADDPRTDEDLVAAINGGDVAAFEALYRRYRSWVVSVAHRFTRDESDALDVLQETFSYVLGKFPGFELRARMTTFLYPAVKHIAIAMRQRRHAVPTSGEVLDELPAAPAPPDASSERAALAAVIERLPAAQREVLVLRFADDMSLEEIAAALEIPVGTVKSRIHHGLQRLREDERTARYFLEG